MALVKIGHLSIDQKKKVVYCKRNLLTPDEEKDLEAYIKSGYLRKDPVSKTTYTKESIRKWYKDHNDLDGLEAFEKDLKIDWVTARAEFSKVKKEYDEKLEALKTSAKLLRQNNNIEEAEVVEAKIKEMMTGMSLSPKAPKKAEATTEATAEE